MVFDKRKAGFWGCSKRSRKTVKVRFYFVLKKGRSQELAKKKGGQLCFERLLVRENKEKKRGRSTDRRRTKVNKQKWQKVLIFWVVIGTTSCSWQKEFFLLCERISKQKL